MLVAPEYIEYIGISCLAIDGDAHDHDMFRKAAPVFCENEKSGYKGKCEEKEM
jgi:hypothetical protein